MYVMSVLGLVLSGFQLGSACSWSLLFSVAYLLYPFILLLVEEIPV